MKAVRITKNEKTDFIVNMTKKGFQRLTLWYLALSALGVFFSCIPYYFKRSNKDMLGNFETLGKNIKLTTEAFEVLKYGTLVLMVFGFFGFLILLISGTKEYFRAKENKSMILLALFVGMSAISIIFAHDNYIAVFGNNGRYEGIIAWVAYAGLFAAASQLTDKNNRNLLLNFILLFSAINSVVGIFQATKPLSKIFPSFFTNSLNDVLAGTAVVDEMYIANGFTTSPYALAAVVTLALPIALCGMMYEEKKFRKILYTVAVIILTVAGFLTKILPAVIGIGVAAAVIALIEFVRIKSGHGLFVKELFKNPLAIIISYIILAVVAFAVLCKTGIFTFSDAAVIYQDSAFRLTIANPKFYNGNNPVSGIGIYPHLWKEAFSCFKDNWVFGTGLDNLGFAKYGTVDLFFSNTQSGMSGTTDRAYNEFLHIAATTGVASLMFYLGFVAACIKRGVHGVGKVLERKENRTKAAALAGCVGYLAQSFFNISALTATPFFFILLGICFSKTEE